MNPTLSAQPDAASSPATFPAWLCSASMVLAASVLVAVCAHISIPFYFTPVPLSMATFAVLVLGLLLSPRMAAATLVTYLAEGAFGLPVFAPGPLSGLAHLLGPTGGYLIAYPMAATLVSFLWKRTGRSFAGALASAAVGSLIILLCGAIWLAGLTHASAQAIFTLAMLPFFAGDVLKIAAAAGVASGFERLRRFTR